MIYKTGQRSLLLDTLPKANDCFSLFSKPLLQSNSLLRKLFCKLCQRIGLCYMKPRIAKWRYERGFRSLASNLSPDAKIETLVKALDDEEDYDDIPEVIEDIVDIMIQGLQDKVFLMFLTPRIQLFDGRAQKE
jgi:hypothetical protein